MNHRSSKFLSLILRHEPEILGVDLNEAGFTNISLKELSEKIREKKGFNGILSVSRRILSALMTKNSYKWLLLLF